MLGKLKTTIQFAAILLAILRPGDEIGGLYLDQWAMIVAAVDHRLVGGRLPRALRLLALRAPRRMTRVFLTGGSGVVGGALAAGLAERGDELVALARSDEAAAKLEQHGARVVRGDTLDEDALAAGMEGCELLYHVAGINTLCPSDPAALFHVNVRGAEAAVRAAARAGVRRVVLTSSASSLGEVGGHGRATRTRRTAARTCRPTSAPSTRASSRRSRPRGAPGSSSSRSTRPRFRGRAARAAPAGSCIAYLNGRLKAFVETRISLVDIGDCVEGHLLAAERGQPGERYVLNSATLTSQEALEIVSGMTGVTESVRFLPARCRDRRRDADRGQPTACAAGRRRSAARWFARCSTVIITTARRPAASSA